MFTRPEGDGDGRVHEDFEHTYWIYYLLGVCGLFCLVYTAGCIYQFLQPRYWPDDPILSMGYKIKSHMELTQLHKNYNNIDDFELEK